MADTIKFTGDVIITSDVYTATLRRFKRIEWQPAADITAYELATLMPLLMSISKDPLNYWEDYIPADARRHFKISDQ